MKSSTIYSELKEGMTTSEIYGHAFSLLKKYHVSLAARYSLKQAIMDLGPEYTIMFLKHNLDIVI
jgi:hypothetical protein